MIWALTHTHTHSHTHTLNHTHTHTNTHSLGYLFIWDITSIYWDTPVYENAFPYTRGTPVCGNAFPYMGAKPIYRNAFQHTREPSLKNCHPLPQSMWYHVEEACKHVRKTCFDMHDSRTDGLHGIVWYPKPSHLHTIVSIFGPGSASGLARFCKLSAVSVASLRKHTPLQKTKSSNPHAPHAAAQIPLCLEI